MQSYQRIQCIGHTDFKGLSNAVTSTHPLLPSMGTTRQKSSCRNRMQNGPRLLPLAKAGTHPAFEEESHTAAHTAKHGRFGRGGAITTLGVRCVVRNLCARSGQKSILCHLCVDRGNVGEKQRAFGTETRTVRVSVPRRRGPAGSRCSTAVSCAAPVSFAVRYHCDEGQRGKFVNVTVVILFVV